MSDDIEPTSLTECADVRPGDSVCSGWGYLFLNLQRAFVSLLSGAYDSPSTDSDGELTPSLLTIAAPTNRELVFANGGSVTVEWVLLGEAASSYQVLLQSAGGAGSATANFTAAAVCDAPTPSVPDGKGRPLVLQNCATRLALPAGFSPVGGSGVITVQPFSSSGAALLTPFALGIQEMDSGSTWVPTAATVSVLLGPPFPAPPFPRPSRILASGPIVSNASGASLCLSGNATAGVVVDPCDSAAADQQWDIMENHEVHSTQTGRCLDAALGTVGKHVYTNGCVGNGVGQLWNPTSGEL